MTSSAVTCCEAPCAPFLIKVMESERFACPQYTVNKTGAQLGLVLYCIVHSQCSVRDCMNDESPGKQGSLTPRRCLQSDSWLCSTVIMKCKGRSNEVFPNAT
jgi:hypothetical protein